MIMSIPTRSFCFACAIREGRHSLYNNLPAPCPLPFQNTQGFSLQRWFERVFQIWVPAIPILSLKKTAQILPFFHMATQLTFYQDFMQEWLIRSLLNDRKSIFSCYINLDFCPTYISLKVGNSDKKQPTRSRTEDDSSMVTGVYYTGKSHLDRGGLTMRLPMLTLQ